MENPVLPARDQRVLRRAVEVLEGKSFVARLTEMTGEPVTRLLGQLPSSVTDRIQRAVLKALQRSLEVALYRFGAAPIPEPSPGVFRIASGVAGGVSGFFGLSALLLELPVTTTLILRSIAGIAVLHGENLDDPAVRLSCLEVFALGPQGKRGSAGETSYFAARAFLAKSVAEAASTLAERGAAATSGPVVLDLLTSIGARFGIVVSDKLAAGAVPVVGAVGGAAVNLAFMQHFQQMAGAHFAVRRLERAYGADLVREAYSTLAAAMAPAR